MKNNLAFICLCAIGIASIFPAKGQTAIATDNVIVTNNASIINGLSAIGPVETTKSALMGSKEGLTKKAETELKSQALAKGGNVVFVTTNDFINDPNSYFKKVHMVGVVYKKDANPDKSEKPGVNQVYPASTNSSDTTKNISSGLTLSVTDVIGDPAAQTVTVYFTFANPTNINRSINVYGGPKSNGVIANYIQKSTMFDDNGIQYECKDDFYAVSGKELPAGLKLKGMITFSNVLPTTKLIALAKLSVGFSDLDGRNAKRGLIEFRNRKINWSGTAPESNIKTEDVHWDTQIKNLNNGIDFTITGCKGDAKAQTATIFFTFSNPRKTNQKIVVQNGFSDNSSNAFDNDGNQYPFKNVSLADASNNSQITKELPTGLSLKGGITFSNVLPTVNGLAMAKIPVVTSNWDGGGNMIFGMIEVKNVAIDWDKRGAGNKNRSISELGGDYILYSDLFTKLNNGENITNKKVILNNIYFNSNTATLTETSKGHLGNIMLLLMKYPTLKVNFTGNTDNVGREDDNLNLSTNRAKSVVDFLVSKGISRDRMFYQGLGSTKPIADNSTEDGRAKNRRTEMQIIAQ